jgi:2-dehydro-3-deoxyphosphogluconate aldolase/(4S)-4-hydroxy-2-oxoglutarate aldolase
MEIGMVKDRMAVLTTMMDIGLVPILYHPDVEVFKKLIQACANGGAKCFEFTNRGEFAAHEFLEITRHFAKADPSVIMGAGTIVDAPTAAIYVANGARFIVGPVLNPEVARFCNRRKIPYSPGCGTAAEIGTAEELGCEIVKIFPAVSLGPEFVRAVLAPSPWSRLMPTGSVEPTEESLRAWFGAGVAAVGMGPTLFTRQLLDKQDFSGLEAKVRETLRLIRLIRER